MDTEKTNNLLWEDHLKDIGVLYTSGFPTHYDDVTPVIEVDDEDVFWGLVMDNIDNITFNPLILVANIEDEYPIEVRNSKMVAAVGYLTVHRLWSLYKKLVKFCSEEDAQEIAVFLIHRVVSKSYFNVSVHAINVLIDTRQKDYIKANFCRFL